MKGAEMEVLLLWLGRAAGIAGTLLCAFAVVLRLTGKFWFAGFQTGTVLAAGAVAMIFGCLCFAAFVAQNLKAGKAL
jgi:hypothetical protein